MRRVIPTPAWQWAIEIRSPDRRKVRQDKEGASRIIRMILEVPFCGFQRSHMQLLRTFYISSSGSLLSSVARMSEERRLLRFPVESALEIFGWGILLECLNRRTGFLLRNPATSFRAKVLSRSRRDVNPIRALQASAYFSSLTLLDITGRAVLITLLRTNAVCGSLYFPDLLEWWASSATESSR